MVVEEKGIRAKIIPTISAEDAAMLQKELSDALGASSITINIPTEQDEVFSEGTDTTTEDIRQVMKENSEGQVRAQREALDAPESKSRHREQVDSVKGVDASIKEGTEGTNKLQGSLSILQSIGSGVMSGMNTAMGLISVGVDFLATLYDRIKRSSAMLTAVYDLFDMATTLFFMPIGDIIGKELLPLAKEMVTSMAEWRAMAFEAYDKGGWAGLIGAAIETGIGTLVAMLNSSTVQAIWDAMKNAPLIGGFFSFVETALRFIVDGGIPKLIYGLIALSSIMTAFYAFFQVYAMLGAARDIPGAAAVGIVAGVGTFGLSYGIMEATGTNELLGAMSAESLSPLRESVSSPRYTTTMQSTSGTTMGGNTVNSNVYITGLTNDELKEEIRRTVDDSVKLARSRGF